MAEPHEILGVHPGASEAEIRAQYLRLVRSHPPDREPQRFAEIRAAYEEIRDPETRLGHLLLEHRSRETVDGLLREVAADLVARPLPTEVLLSMAEES